MSDPFENPDDPKAEGSEAGTPPEDELFDAGEAEAMEERQAIGELEAEGLDPEEAEAQVQAAVQEAHRRGLEARVWWSFVHKELLTLLLANCFFFAGTLVAWDRPLPWDSGPVRTFTGLDTIRGGLIFALALYGFWILVFDIWYRQLKIWPFLLNALVALWVGIGGIASTVGSPRMDGASGYLKNQTTSLLDSILAPLSSIAPGFWLLTAGGAIVFIVLLRGLMGGRAAAKAAVQSGAGSRRRRR